MATVLPIALFVVTIALSLTWAPDIASATELRPATELAELDRYLDSITPFAFAGAVLVARDGEILLHKGYGSLTPDGTPAEANTLFDIGSITKSFTAAAVLKLQEMGQLSVTDSLGQFLASWPDDKDEITLHHLLTHTSGLPAAVGKDDEPLGRDALIQKAAVQSLQSSPGELFAYSNVGYSLLAAVVEKVSGRDWEDFVRSELLLPSGMRNTGFTEANLDTTKIAPIWTGAGGEIRSPLARPQLSWNLLGNGGMISTVYDLFLWARALKAPGVLSYDSLRLLTTGYVPWPGRPQVEYGYGWEVATTATGSAVLRHTGGSPDGVNGTLM